jgi:hypothetical protein
MHLKGEDTDHADGTGKTHAEESSGHGSTGFGSGAARGARVRARVGARAGAAGSLRV